MQLFVRKGGKFRPSLMAIDEERALSDFPNLLPIGQAKVMFYDYFMLIERERNGCDNIVLVLQYLFLVTQKHLFLTFSSIIYF